MPSAGPRTASTISAAGAPMAPKMAAAGPFDPPDVQSEAEMAKGHQDMAT